jgi:hypothetical protein
MESRWHVGELSTLLFIIRTVIDYGDYQRFFLTTSADLTARLFSLNPIEGYRPKTLAGHRDMIIGGWFGADQATVSHPVLLEPYQPH